jgi:lipopolysaccharide export system permease protein
MKRLLGFIPILDRYIISDLIGPFLFGIVGIVIIGMVDILFTMIDLFINSGVPFAVVMKILVYKIPAIMVLFFPMAMLFSCMIVLIRMAKDSEITVLRAGGISLLRIVVPVVIMGLIVSLCAFLINEKVVPWANHVSDNIIRKVILKKPPPDIVKNTFFKAGGQRYFYIRKISAEKKLMEDIMVYELTTSFPRFITAKTATWSGKEWILLAGKIHKFNEDGFLNYDGQFKKMTIKVDRDVHSFFTNEKTPREMSSGELSEKIKGLQKGGVDTKNLVVDYHMKYSRPLANLSFALIGIALCITFVRSSKDWWGVIIGVLLALLTVGFYLFVMATFRSLGRGGMISPFLGAWSPNILFTILAGILLVREGIYK